MPTEGEHPGKRLADSGVVVDDEEMSHGPILQVSGVFRADRWCYDKRAVSPIYVRPAREQAEHDRLIRFLQAQLSGRFEVAVNEGDLRDVALKLGESTYFPDLVLFEGKKLAGLIEIETGESTNNLEALAQWVHFGKAKVPFSLYVPELMLDTARRFCQQHQVSVSEIWTYRTLMDGFDLVKAFHDPQAVAKAPKAPAPKIVFIPRPEPPKPEPIPEPPPAPVEPPSAKPVKSAVKVAPAKATKAAAPVKPVAPPPVIKPTKAAPVTAKAPVKAAPPAKATKPAVKPAPPVKSGKAARAAKPAPVAKAPVKKSAPVVKKKVAKATKPVKPAKPLKSAPKKSAAPAKGKAAKPAKAKKKGR
jgi:hypothetical protein